MKTHMFRNVVLGALVAGVSLFGTSQVARADHHHHFSHHCGSGFGYPGVQVNSGYYGYSMRPPVYGYNGYSSNYGGYNGFATPQFVAPSWGGYGAGGFPMNGSYGGGSFPTYGSYGGRGFSLYIGR